MAVPIKELLGKRARCPRPGCVGTGPVERGTNPKSALGSTVRPPAQPWAFPPGSIQYEYPPVGPGFHIETFILRCNRCGPASYFDNQQIEPAPDEGQEVNP
jgi:hypothetical protein